MHRLQPVAPVAFWYVPGSHCTQAPSRPTAATVPAAHAVCSVLPVGLKCPGAVGLHSAALVRLVKLEKLPSSHGRGAAEPSLQYEPASHATHAVAPSLSWYVPGAHLTHDSTRAWSLNVPALQLVAEALPTGQNTPVEQGSQSAALVITTPTFLVVPPGHGSGAAEPAAQ